jgi:hypothetical protein
MRGSRVPPDFMTPEEAGTTPDVHFSRETPDASTVILLEERKQGAEAPFV